MPNGQEIDKTTPPKPTPATTVHELPDGVFDGEMHFGVAITVTADGKQSTIMIPDATKISKGAPVYTTGRVGIHGEHLTNFLEKKGAKLPKALSDLIGGCRISCDAFYYSTKPFTFKKDDGKFNELKNKLGLSGTDWNEWLNMYLKSGSSDEYEIDEGPLLMMFSIDFDKGLIGSLTGDEHLGELFDVTGGSVRVLRCPSDKADTLKEYVKFLQQAP